MGDSAGSRRGFASRRSLLRRGLPALLLGVLLGGAAGFGHAAMTPTRYTATSRVLVTDPVSDRAGDPAASGVPAVPGPVRPDPGPTAGGATTGGARDGVGIGSAAASVRPGPASASGPDLQTEVQLVTSDAVRRGAIALFHDLSRESTSALLASAHVHPDPAASTLAISFTARTPAAAEAGSIAWATAYLQDRQRIGQALLDRRLATADAELTRLTALERTASRRAATTAGPARTAALAQLEPARRRVGAQTTVLATLHAVVVDAGRLVVAAPRPTHPSTPSTAHDVAVGSAAGLAAGVLLALLTLRFRRRIRTAEDLAYALTTRCVAVLPFADVADDDGTAVHRRLALLARAVAPGERLRLLMTTPLDSASSGWVAAGVAASLAAAGTSAAMLTVPGPHPGVPAPESVASHTVARADDLVRGGSDTMAAALDRVQDERTALVVDVPGTVRRADAETLATHADAVLLVVDAGTRTSVARAAHDRLVAVGAVLVGTVLIRRGGGPLDPATVRPLAVGAGRTGSAVH